MRAWAFSAMLVVLAVLASAGAAQRPPPLIVVASDRVQNSAGQIYLLDPYTGRKQNLSRGRRTWGDGAVFGARRSMALAFTRAELICCSTGRVFRDVWIREGSGRQLNLTATPELDEKAPSVSPDGRTVAYYRHLPTPSGRDDVRLVVHSRGGPAREVARLPFTIFEPPAWSPDGETLLVGENDPAPEATIWLAPLNRPARKVDLPTAFDAAWLPSGRVVVAGSRVREGRLDLFLLDAGGTVLRQLTRRAVPAALARWPPARVSSPDLRLPGLRAALPDLGRRRSRAPLDGSSRPGGPARVVARRPLPCARDREARSARACELPPRDRRSPHAPCTPASARATVGGDVGPGLAPWPSGVHERGLCRIGRVGRTLGSLARARERRCRPPARRERRGRAQLVARRAPVGLRPSGVAVVHGRLGARSPPPDEWRRRF